MDREELILLFDYYGELLTDRQKECFELRYGQDLSYGEIGEELGISRQGVFDNLSRAEALLCNMEEKTGCVRRDRMCRTVAQRVAELAQQLRDHTDTSVSALAHEIQNELQKLQ